MQFHVRHTAVNKYSKYVQIHSDNFFAVSLVFAKMTSPDKHIRAHLAGKYGVLRSYLKLSGLVDVRYAISTRVVSMKQCRTALQTLL